MRILNTPLTAIILASVSLPLLLSCDSSDDNSTTTAAPKLTQRCGVSIPASETRVEHLSSGDATVKDCSTQAFSKSSANITDPKRITTFNSGNHLFENPWVPGSQSTQMRDGLGPYFNNDACQGCHINDGRGHAANAALDGISKGIDFESMLIRVSRSDITADEKARILASEIPNIPDSIVGGQLQQHAVINSNSNQPIQNEVDLAVSYTQEILTFTDGEAIELRRPIWHMQSNFQGGFDTDSVFSARVAPPMIGLGLLQMIQASDILALEDIDDSDLDGISGKANLVHSLKTGTTMLGRFGWKAGQPSLLEQSSGAFFGDMGLTSFLHEGDECNADQVDCQTAPNGNGDNASNDNYEVSNSSLAEVRFYSNHLAVPQRRNAYGAKVQQGKALFIQAGCAACHTPSYTTGVGDPTLSNDFHEELENQVIFPYSDMLLHDMGTDLADFRADGTTPVTDDVQVEYLATATEWRTPPLWGLGLSKTVDPDVSFLHDGRARTIMESVIWHGGEAKAAQQAVINMTKTEREALLAFLNDL